MHLRFSDGIEVEGWVDKSALGPVAGFGMSGCYGCGLGVGYGHVRPKNARVATLRRTSRVFVGESLPGVARGTVQAGAEVIVFDELSGFARVYPQCQEIMPTAKNAFFVSRADLDVGAPVDKITPPSCR